MTQALVQLGVGRGHGNASWRACCRWSAYVALGFSVAVMLVLLSAFLGDARENPMQTARLTELRTKLQATPEDEAVKQQIRAIDQQVRETYFERRAFFRTGTLLLVGGILALVVSLMIASELSAAPYLPTTDILGTREGPEGALLTRRSLASAAAFGALVWGGSAYFYRPSTPLPSVASSDVSIEKNEAADPRVAETPITPEDYQRNWPALRGPNGNARATGVYAKDWDVATGRNVAWKAAVPLPGNNSPVVWNDRVFLSGADESKREIYCFDATSGALVWKQSLPTSAPVQVNEETGFACSTLATDGRRVYAIFPAGDLFAFDFAAKKVWSKSLGVPENTYGHASSLLTYGDRLIVQFDQFKGDRGTGKSILYAFDGETGNLAWQTVREVEAAWSTPLIANTSVGPQLIVLGHPYHAAYGPDTGKELWRVSKVSGEIAPSPAYANDRVITADGYHAVAAINANGAGDVTKSHIPWKFEDDIPDIVSPATDGELVFVVISNGMVICCDFNDGKELWRQELETPAGPSPVIAGPLVYLLDTKGTMHVFEAAREWKPIGKSTMDEACTATPAFVGGRIYVRTASTLYCIAAPGAAPSSQPIGGSIP